MSSRSFRGPDGVEIAVDVRNDRESVALTRDGEPRLECTIRRVGTAEFVARDPNDPGALHSVYAVRDGDQYWVWLDGRTYRLETVRQRGRGAAAAGGLVAPIPATVQEILVGEGDAVEQGQVLLVLTAMKMQLEVKAPRAGVVSGLALAVGDQVDGGVELLQLTDPEG